MLAGGPIRGGLQAHPRCRSRWRSSHRRRCPRGCRMGRFPELLGSRRDEGRETGANRPEHRRDLGRAGLVQRHGRAAVERSGPATFRVCDLLTNPRRCERQPAASRRLYGPPFVREQVCALVPPVPCWWRRAGSARAELQTRIRTCEGMADGSLGDCSCPVGEALAAGSAPTSWLTRGESRDRRGSRGLIQPGHAVWHDRTRRPPERRSGTRSATFAGACYSST